MNNILIRKLANFLKLKYQSWWLRQWGLPLGCWCYHCCWCMHCYGSITKTLLDELSHIHVLFNQQPCYYVACCIAGLPCVCFRKILGYHCYISICVQPHSFTAIWHLPSLIHMVFSWPVDQNRRPPVLANRFGLTGYRKNHPNLNPKPKMSVQMVRIG